MIDKLSLEQLNDLADFEKSDMPVQENVWYIAWLWSILQDLSEEFASDLQRDYKIYIEEIKT
jgi:hypothetical protein